ncbi:TetR/AcrR family transcriptional regulator [Pseudorhodoferax sp.]|uniref:TetR/AcrR family transcriptional regulator n=1 Tax=Pseudorhodoferax sp. TaxID=1993553 RepID=UPI002DD62F5B|nr:TetR/AcrR family transcriptional regulator [Pseudorhodoferax sp.]
MLTLAAGPLAAQHTSAPKQRRGQLRQQALVEAGLRLTATRRWAEVTVADIAAAIGCSVGTFYTRFHNKDAYFAVLQQLLAEVLLQRLQAFHAAPQRRRESASAFIAAWTQLIARSYCLHRGLYAAALAQTQQLPREAVVQLPLARVRLATRAQLVAAMAARPGWAGEAAAARLGFAHQMLHGVLVSAVLTDPGPLQLDEPALVEQASCALCAYLGLPRPRRPKESSA